MENPQIPPEQPTMKVSHAALRVALGGGFSLLAGLASQVVTAYFFGAGSEMDAFFTAMTIPLYLQIVLLGGLPFVVIPAFVNEENSGHEDDAWSLTGTLVWFTSGFLFLMAVLGALFARDIINITAPGFGDEKSFLSAQMLAIMIFSVPFMGLSSFTSGVENIRGRYFWPATATAIGSLGNLVVLLVFHSSLGPISLAWGNLASAILMASVTTIPVFKHGWKEPLPLNDPRLVEILKLVTPFILFGLITSSRLILERYFASVLPDGDLSYMGYANKISNIFVVLLATSIASPIFPAMARAYSQEGIPGLVKQSDYGLRLTLAVALPAVTIITVLSIPLVRLLFERGAFLADTTLSVSLIIPIFMVNDVLFRMINNMIGRTFFVLKDTLTTNLISSLTILIYIFTARALTEKWGYFGLALAQPIQAGCSILIMSLLLIKKLKNAPVLDLLKSAVVYMLISLIVALIGWVTIHFLNFLPSIFQLGFGGLVSLSLYLFILNKIDPRISLSIFEMTGLQKVYSAIKTRIIFANEVPPS
jgi:putative peptidoglycan lipid II flippase